MAVGEKVRSSMICTSRGSSRHVRRARGGTITNGRGGAAEGRGGEARLVDDADDPAGVGDGAELRVVDVAPVWADARHARMAHHERLRLVLDRDRVEEAFAINVREVHEDASLVQAPHVVLPNGGEAPVLAQPGEG